MPVNDDVIKTKMLELRELREDYRSKIEEISSILLALDSIEVKLEQRPGEDPLKVKPKFMGTDIDMSETTRTKIYDPTILKANKLLTGP